MSYYRKTLPLELVLNRLVSLADCHNKTAQNIMDSADKFSSRENALDIAQRWLNRGAELELFAEEIVKWKKGDTNHIFTYCTDLSDDAETMKHVIEDRVQIKIDQQLQWK